MDMRQVLKCFYKAGKAVERLGENEWEGVSWKQDTLVCIHFPFVGDKGKSFAPRFKRSWDTAIGE